MSVIYCYKQQPQPWMYYITPEKICFTGECCPVLVTDRTHLLPFQVISQGAFVKFEYRLYGETAWAELTITYSEVIIEGFYFISYNGSAVTELPCGVYEFRLTAGEVWWFEPIKVEDFTITENAFIKHDDLMTPMKFTEQLFDTTALIAPCDMILPFMFRTENVTSGTITVYMVDEEGTETEITITVTTGVIDGMTYYWHSEEYLYPFLSCGRYYLKIVDGANTYYSVPFVPECGISDIPDGYKVLRDFNGCVMRDEAGNILIEEMSDLLDVLLVDASNPAKVYLYDVPSKVATLLDVPDITGVSADIAHTENKLWLYGSALGQIREWDITLEPFSAIFNRNITGIYKSAGLCSKDDTTVITVSGQAALPILPIVQESDVTNIIALNTAKISLLPDRYITGDYCLTSTNKFIILTTAYPTGEKHITQYNYLTGVLEVDVQISPTMTAPFGLFEYNNEIYITDYRTSILTYIWKIDKNAPYNLTLYDSLNIAINGASQFLSQLTTHLLT